MMVHAVQLILSLVSFIVVFGSRKEHKLSIDERIQKIERNIEGQKYPRYQMRAKEKHQDRKQYKVSGKDPGENHKEQPAAGEVKKILAKAISHKTVPVVFVFLAGGGRGQNLEYMLYNIELATLNNDVVVITDDKNIQVKAGEMHGHTLEVLPAKAFNDLSREFKRIYVYQGFQGRAEHPQERYWRRANFLRWLILCSYMVKTWTPRVFFADGDVSLYYNMDQAFTYKAEMGCEGAINVESQMSRYHWTGAGESSMWTIQGIINFSKFLFIMYSRFPTNYIAQVLDKKYVYRPAVADMTILFLWWYQNKEHLIPTRNAPIESWYEVGLPWHGRNDANSHKNRSDDIRDTIARKKFKDR